jgi:uncharacterized protein (DUF885 family)
MADAIPKDDPVFALSSDLVDAYSAASPVMASMAGVPGAWSGWDDYSPAGAERMRALLTGYRDRLAALAPPGERWGKLARSVTAEFIDDKLSYYEHGDHLCDLNNIESPLQHMRMVFDVMDTSADGGWEAVAERLENIGRAHASYRAALEEGARRGLVPAKRQVAAALSQARTHASDSSSFRGILRAFDASGHPGSALRTRIERAVEVARAAYGPLSEFLEAFQQRAADKDAIGPERYARAARRFLGTDIDLMETYAWGFSEIETIERSMRELAARISPGKSVAEIVADLQRSPEQLVTDTEAFLRIMRQRQERALAELLGTHFEVPEPIRTIEIKLAPEGGALGAYYVPPSDGFTRPGTVFYAPGADPKFTLFSEITTAYHEGFPGHHLQCGLQVYYADKLSRLHRLFVVCSGYAEGWALYAEQLMDELGYYDRPEYVLGMHMAKLFRACRVVADIGMHLELAIPASFDFHPGQKWTWEHCVELLVERAFAKRDFAESEATRYLGWPGQAISYKVGERAILDLRREMREGLGSGFDLRSFHQAVLGTGSVGLDLLRDAVRSEMLAAG